MAVKTNQELKKQKKAEKRAKVDKITNWFMINLAWGIFSFIILRYLQNPIMTDYDNTVRNVLGILGIIIGVAAVALFAIRATLNYKELKFVKNKNRVLNYGIFTAIVAIVLVYLKFYTNVRNVVVAILPFTQSFHTNFWITNGLSYAIWGYLLIAFIYTAVKIALIEKKK